MKKRIFISLALAVVLLLSVSGIALAADPTTVHVEWDGTGVTEGSVTSGNDAHADFYSGGNTNVGQFDANDQNDNPYGYGVDSCSFALDTAMTGSGSAWLTVYRDDAKSSYGAPGQVSDTFVAFSGGSASLQNRSNTNYASMRDCNYGWNSNDHVTVMGAAAYTLARSMDSGAGNYAAVSAIGSGDADLDCMNAEASAGQVRLGAGCGCYTNADFTATGTGSMTLAGVGNNSATTAMAPGMVGASSFSFIASWVNSTFTVPDYSTTAN